MIFPEHERVIYTKNPLHMVVCQVRFPAILRIASEPPVEFQERVRGEYPLFVEKREATINLPGELSKKLPSEFLKADTAFEFGTSDEQWKLSLTKSFLALASTRYERWEQFRDHLAVPLQSLHDIYSPSFFTRIGLRYQDVIKKSTLDFGDDVRWKDLLNPQLAGELSNDEVASAIVDSSHEFLIKQNSRGNVRVRHGLVRDDGTEEVCYMIDADFFTEERLEGDDVIKRLDEFNREAGRFFRWSIAEQLHDAMGPQPVE